MSAAYPQAIAEGALRRVCAADGETLRNHFKTQGWLWQEDLLQKHEATVCHIHYRSTIPGFRAAPDSSPVSELFANVNTLAFLSKRSEQNGDSLDVIKQVLRNSDAPLDVTLDLSVGEAEAPVAEAIRFHFGETPHHFRVHLDKQGDIDPWMQDVLKYGYANGEKRVLVTRRSFEGSARNGALLQPMLDSFRDLPFVRSRLSFEGGDLLLSRSPRDRNRLVLFYGTSAKPYWAESLSREEFAYVLRQEFGADEAMYLQDVTPHVDYSLSFLTDGKTALVAEPKCGDRELARAALTLLSDTYTDPVPPELARLQEALRGMQEAGNDGAIVEALSHARAAAANWSPPDGNPERERIARYVKAHCPGQPQACLSPQRIPELLANEQALLHSWMRLGNAAQKRAMLAPRLLEIIRRQAAGCDETARRKLEENAQRLAEMGYRVIRVPWLQGDGVEPSDWPGISYVNAAVVGDRLFLPQLGFGPPEQAWFDEIQRQLPAPYKLVAVPASNLLLQNGGIHCVLAFGHAAPR